MFYCFFVLGYPHPHILTMPYITSANPSESQSIIGTIESSTPIEVKDTVDRARIAYATWSHTPVSKRVTYLREVYDGIVENREILAQGVAREMGMPIRLARDEVGYGISYCAWYLDNAEKYLAPEVTHEDENEIHTVTYEGR